MSRPFITFLYTYNQIQVLDAIRNLRRKENVKQVTEVDSTAVIALKGIYWDNRITVRYITMNLRQIIS